MSRFHTTKKMRDDFGKCIDKAIRIYPVAVQDEKGLYFIEVDLNGNIKRDNEKLKEEECWTKIFKYYDYYAKRD